MFSGSLSVIGNSLILGPRKISTSLASFSSAGAITILSFIKKCSGISMGTSFPKFCGFVNTPARAEAAAVSGLTK